VGSSAWLTFTLYSPDLTAALLAAQLSTFHAGNYYWAGDGEPPATIEELWQDPAVHGTGTHAILDIFELIGPDEPDTPMAVRPLSRDRLLMAFGTDRPTRAQFDAAYRTDLLDDGYPRWCGRCCTLYVDDGPSEIAFWGASGD